jgi:branched-subunit amino acid transport protein
MDQMTIFLTIVGMGVVTYLPRLLPVWFLSNRTLPPLVATWLRFVPVAVLAALLLPSLVMPEDRLDMSFNNLYLWAALPAIVVAWRTRSFFGTVLVGMGLVALLRWLVG